MPDPTLLPAISRTPSDDADTVVKLMRAVTSLAHSLAVQIAATAAVTLAVASIPWLHESAPAPAPAPQASAPAVGASTLELAGILPAAAFPMEGDARFGLALHRTYRIVADATWSDGTPIETAQQATTPRPTKRKAVAESGPAAGEALPAPQAVPVQPVVAMLPPERPRDLPVQAALASSPNAAVPMNGPTGIASFEMSDLPALPLPPLPSVGEVSREIGTRAAEARDVVTRTASWAAAGVGNVIPRF